MVNPIYFFSPIHTGTHFVIEFLEGHPEIDLVTYNHKEYYHLVESLETKIAIHSHAPEHIRMILAYPRFVVKNPIITIRDPVKSLISRCSRAKNLSSSAGPVLNGFLSITKMENAFYLPIDLDVDHVQLMQDLCNHVDLTINDYVLQVAKDWKPSTSEINSSHKKLTKLYAEGGLDALVEEMPIPFLELKLHAHFLQPFLESHGYELNW